VHGHPLAAAITKQDMYCTLSVCFVQASSIGKMAAGVNVQRVFSKTAGATASKGLQ
jgi:hypothetical protein